MVMDTVAEPLQVLNGVRPVFLLRRVRVARPLALAVTFLFLSQPLPAQRRREAILRLRDDVSTAIAHASLTERQTQKLDRCRQTLLLAAQSGRVRQSASRRDLDGAVKDLERLLQSGIFQFDDTELVRQDIDALRTVQRNQSARR
jgi:hypothetical protein